MFMNISLYIIDHGGSLYKPAIWHWIFSSHQLSIGLYWSCFFAFAHEPSQVRKSCSYLVLGSKLPFLIPISKDIWPSHVSILDTPWTLLSHAQESV